MSQVAFSTISTNPLASQPNSASEKVILRSTEAADTATVTVYGMAPDAPDSDAVALTGKVEVQTGTGGQFATISQALLSSACAGIVTGLGQGTAAVGDCTGLVNPTDGATLTIGLAGFTTVYRFKSIPLAAYDVQIGANVIATMLSLTRALNADGTAGGDYFAGTLAHPQLSATVDTSVMTVTDRLACDRQLAWVMTESGAFFAKRVPRDGVDGVKLFSFAAGVTSAADKLTFSTEDHSAATLPALMLGVSNYVQTAGEIPHLRVWSDHDLVFKIQDSTDLVNWTDTIDGLRFVTGGEIHQGPLTFRSEFIRMVLTENLNTTDTILDARVIY